MKYAYPQDPTHAVSAIRRYDESSDSSTSQSALERQQDIAVVGETYSRLQAAGDDYLVASVTYEGQGRAIVKQKEIGLGHLYASPTGEFLGAEIFAPNAEHLAHLLAWARAQRLTVGQILSMPFYHPVLEEGLRTGFRKLNESLTKASPLEIATVPVQLDNRGLAI